MKWLIDLKSFSKFGLYQLKNPLKLLNLLGLKLAYHFRWQKVPFLPIYLDIEPNNNCNFKCSHCQVTHWDKPIAHIDANSFSHILKQFPNLIRVKLQGMGEPLLNKNLISMLTIGENRGISMRFISNGSLCNQKIAEQLATLKNTEITFSLDGATAEVFEKLRVGGKFAQVIENISNLVKIRNRKQQPVLSTWTVVNHNNIDEVPKIVELAGEIGLDQITLQPFVSDWGKEEMKEHTSSIQVDTNSNKFKDTLEKAKQIAQQESIDLNINTSNFFSEQKPCHWPWKSAYIASNGDVVPCCVLADSDIVKMGNVFEQDFTEIWNSKEYQNLRKKIKTHNLPSFCK
ncbi:MAG: radical SAM/SPASM domain-containing protein, partial [Waterburya sp.]